MDRAIVRDKPLKMFIYQPVFLGDKYVLSTIIKFPFCRLEVGDVFTTEKRPSDYHKMKRQEESKVEAIRYNLAEGACIVILEKKTFKEQKEIDLFVRGKSCIC